MKKRIWAALTAAMMLTATCAGADTVKKERVYAVTNAAGELQSVTDNIQLQNPDGLDVLTDRSKLTGIENVGGHETFTVDGDVVTWNAGGSSIRYQGTGTDALAATPVVTCTFEGASVSPADLADQSGELTLDVSYTLAAATPVLALTAMIVPEGMTDITLKNAYLLDEGTQQIIVGYAVPGADEALGLPAGFSVTCKADHVSLSWMMTLATSDPVELLCDQASGYVQDAETLVTQLTQVLTALKDGTEMPALDGDLGDIAGGLTTLLSGVGTLNDGAAAVQTGAASLADGASQLSTGAAALADGASQLSTGASALSDGAAQVSTGAATLSDGAASVDAGAASLETGLTTLTASSDALNAGASQLFTAVLATANQQLAASGLSAAGITLPELTAENYAAVLDGAIEQLNTMISQASASAEAQVRAAVTAQESTIREAVTQAVQARVLTAVLTAAGVTMSAEDYTAAITAGKIPADTSAQIDAAVTAQMTTDETKAAIDAAVNEQIGQLVSQNLASEAVQTQISQSVATAQAGIDSLTVLKAQLDQVSTFVTGLATYTDGVAQAQAGSVTLHQGTTQLASGASTLATGASTLSDSTVTLAAGASTLSDSTATLAAGAVTLSSGADELSAGTLALSDGTSQLKTRLHDTIVSAAEKLLPYLTGDAQKYIDAFNHTRDSAELASGYDLVADGMTSETVYIIRTDLR